MRVFSFIIILSAVEGGGAAVTGAVGVVGVAGVSVL